MKLSDIDKVESRRNPELAETLKKLKEEGRLFPKEKDGIPVVGGRPVNEDIERFEDEGGFISLEGADKELAEASKQKLSASLLVEFNRHPLSQRFHDLLAEAGALHDKKQKDYGSSDDPFFNLRDGSEFGIPPWVVAMSKGNDKMVRIKNYAKTGTLANEGVEDSFMDLAVFALIARVLWEEENAK